MESSSELVSVIIAVYQGEGCVLGALHSALNQTYTNIEVLVVDDGSTDRTWAILQSAAADPRVRLYHQDNSGASAARNLGLANARGQYIAFLDADDVWLPNKLETEVATLKRSGAGAAIAYSWYYAVDERGTVLNRSPKSRYAGMVFDEFLTKGHTFILPSASLFHRDIFKSIGGYNSARRHHEDFTFTLRALRTYPAFPTGHFSVLYCQSLNGKGRSVMQNYEKAVKAALSLADDLGDVLSESEAQQLRDSQRKSLYFRFLTYGFNASARRMLEDFPGAGIGGGLKGILGIVFAKTNINLMLPARTLVQAASRLFSQRSVRRYVRPPKAFEVSVAG